MAKKKHPATRDQPLDVDSIIAKADRERKEADPYHRPSSRWGWDSGVYAPLATTGDAAAIPVRRPSGEQFNPFKSARDRKAARIKSNAKKRASGKKS